MIRSLFLSHGPAKLLSMILAIGLWGFLIASEQRVGTFPGGVPIVVENVPAGLVAILDEGEVRVSLVAERAVWQRLSVESFTAVVDASGATQGVSDLDVQVRSSLPEVQITRVVPNRVLVRFEAVASKRVPIRVQLDGQAAEGFVPGDPALDPSEVTIQGSSSQLDLVTEATVRVTLAGERDELTQRLNPIILDGRGQAQSLRTEPAEVAVRVPIVRASNVKSLGVLLKTTGATPPGFSLSKVQLTPSVVAVTGLPQVLASLGSIATEPIELGSLTSSQDLTAPLSVPDGVRLVDLPEARVTVSLELTELSTQRAFRVPLTLTSLTPGLVLEELSPLVAEVRVAGPARQVAALTELELAITLSATTLKATGTHTFHLEPSLVRVPGGIEVLAITPGTVTVRLGSS
ncbi:hypothetical protein HY375_01260 [Candidatus Berkelbacteria bacterium]|nr:hypothetical protein [Candidatus Berkelbacteria bacterium]